MAEADDMAMARELRSAATRQREATQRLHEAIRGAAARGMSFRRIASVVGLNYSQIHRIVRAGR
jgi:hypothetical protein